MHRHCTKARIFENLVYMENMNMSKKLSSSGTVMTVCSTMMKGQG